MRVAGVEPHQLQIRALCPGHASAWGSALKRSNLFLDSGPSVGFSRAEERTDEKFGAIEGNLFSISVNLMH
jgi:hypothetical protein